MSNQEVACSLMMKLPDEDYLMVVHRPPLLQTRGSTGVDPARHWAEVIAARNAEQHRLTTQMQACHARESTLTQQLSTSKRSCHDLQVRHSASAEHDATLDGNGHSVLHVHSV